MSKLAPGFPQTSASLSQPTLQVRELAVTYKVRGGEVDVIENVSFDIAPGETFGLVGESGCGKSTTAWAIVNFLGKNGYVKHGSIKFQGNELVGRSEAELQHVRGDQIAMVYQDPQQSLNPSMRIGNQMKEVLTVHREMSDEEATARCIEMLNRVYMPDAEEVMTRYPHQLSGGQLQRVVIATALLNDPALLIMDEPTTALDVTVEAAVLDLISDLRRDFDMALLFISHNLGIIAHICDNVGVMYAGELVEQATVADLFATPKHPYTQDLLRCVPQLGDEKGSGALYAIPGRVPLPGARPFGCTFSPRCSYVQDRCREEHPQLRRLPNGTMVRCHFAEEISAGDRVLEPRTTPSLLSGSVDNKDVILRVDHLQKYYPVQGNTLRDVLGRGENRSVKALEQATFSVPSGSTLGIVGESGSGKSTLIKTIIGLEASTDGRVEFLGFDISMDLSGRDMQLIEQMQMVFQNPEATMNPVYSVGQQIARPMIRFGTVPKSQVYTEAIRLLDAVRLDPSYYDRLPRQLSGGEKQRVGIARALASRPELILCDEPISALDVSVQAALLNLLLEVQIDRGTTMLLIAHDLGVVRYFSDHVAVMYLGEIVEIGSAEAVYSPPYHPYTEALLSAVPVPDPTADRPRIRLQGTIPSAIDPPTGCRFHTRCPRRKLLPNNGQICVDQHPPWQVVDDGHGISCHIPVEQLRQLGDVDAFDA